MNPLVLVLDDQIRYTHALHRAIGTDFEVITAASVKEAQEKMSGAVRLVVSDVRLDESIPRDRQGLDFIRWLRAAFPSVSVVALSALDDSDLEECAINAGATMFLRKPVAVSTLRATLSQLIGSKGSDAATREGEKL